MNVLIALAAVVCGFVWGMTHGRVWPQLNVRWMARAARSLQGVRRRPNRRLESVRSTSLRATQKFLAALLGTVVTAGMLAVFAANWSFLVPYSVGLFVGFSPAFILAYWRVSALVGVVLLVGVTGMLLYDAEDDPGESIRMAETTGEPEGDEQQASPQPAQPPPPPAPALMETDEAPQEEEPQELTLPGIPFAFNGQTIPSASLPALNETVRLLNDHPQISVLIEGYSDAVGSEAFNLELSRNRAEAVRAYLVERGIAAERLRVVGRGEVNPLAPNARDDGSDNPAGRAMNRRVELSVE